MSKLLQKNALICIFACGGGEENVTSPNKPDTTSAQIHQFHHAQITLQ